MQTETTDSHRSAPLWLLVAAFAAVYVIWGSTYLAIRYAVETIPPFLLAGSRSVVAGLLLFVFARRRGAPAPAKGQWRDATIAGALMLTLGNGGVTWAEQMIPSSVTALLIGLTPAWMVLFDWFRPGGNRPGGLVILGLAVGFGGVALLARGETADSGSAYGWGVAVLLASSVGWAYGSVFSRNANKPESPFLNGGMQMISGGALLLGCAVVAGEFNSFAPGQVTWLSLAAWAYLMVAGSIVAYTAYVWLLQVSTPARVSTSAYVNPLIAVVLGCTVGQEAFSQTLLTAGTLILTAVLLVLRGGALKPTAAANCEEVV